MADHDALIDRLARDVRPVRRPAPPWQRTAAWLLLALPCGALASWALQRRATDWSQPGAAWAGLDIMLSFALGVLAMVSAFRRSIAGREALGWRWFAPLAAAWVCAAVAGVASSGDPFGRLGDGVHCYAFMLLAGAPMIAIVLLALRSTPSLQPERTLVIAGLGVAAITQCLLGLCHPVAVHLLDLGMHLAGALTLTLGAVLAGRRCIAIE